MFVVFHNDLGGGVLAHFLTNGESKCYVARYRAQVGVVPIFFAKTDGSFAEKDGRLFAL